MNGQRKQRVAAREGWYTLDADRPRLLGGCCSGCGTYYFPPGVQYCRNPACDSEQFDEVELSNRGRIWSCTTAEYPPPPPFVAPEPYTPFALAAVELEKEKIVILGQLATGVSIGDVAIGDEVELVLETLFEDDDKDYLVWKWRPLEAGAEGAAA